MKKRSVFVTNPELRIPLAGFLAWLLPGAGHLFVGERTRGLIILVSIALTFWTGVALGGIKTTVDPTGRSLWFLGQICTGSHALVAVGLSRHVQPGSEQTEDDLIAYGRTEEVAVVYTAICGMLNILVILDVLVRAERKQPDSLPTGASGGGSA